MSQHPAHPTPPPAHTMPPGGATSPSKPDDKKETDPNAGPQEKAAEEARAKDAAPPKPVPVSAPPPPPTYKDSTGADVHPGDSVTIKGVATSVSPDDASRGGNVSIETDNPIDQNSLEKDHFTVRTATVVGGGPAKTGDDAKKATPPGGSTAPQHAAPQPSAQPHTPPAPGH